MPEDTDEVSLDWMDEKKAPAPGTYIWLCAITAVTIKDMEREKPYANLTLKVIEGDEAGFSFDYRLYIHKAAKGWARYFLAKFGYPQELLAGDNPKLRRSALVDPKGIFFLSGKIHVEVYDDPKYGRQYDGKGFDHPEGMELEKKLKKFEEVPLLSDSEPAIDVEADVKSEESAKQVDLSFLDAPDVPVQREPGDEVLGDWFYTKPEEK